MNIRILQQHDLSGLLELYAQLHTHEPAVPTDMATAVWQEIQDSPAVRCYGGYVGEVLASTCTLVIVPNLTRGCRSYALIENVVTRSEYRGQGYGTVIVRHAIADAWQRGCYKVMLMTSRKEAAITRFYQGAGFDSHEKNAFVARPNP